MQTAYEAAVEVKQQHVAPVCPCTHKLDVQSDAAERVVLEDRVEVATDALVLK